jgi:lipopolysaccharide export LptBFGC system permease protein LptF
VPLQRIEADKGRWKAGSWILSGVRIHRFSDGGADVNVTEVPEMPMQLKATPEDLARVEKEPKEMSSRELKRYIQRLAQSGEDTRRYAADLLAKRAILMGTCIITAVLYYVLFFLALPLARKDVLPPLLLVWLPNVIFGGIALVGLLRPRPRV